MTHKILAILLLVFAIVPMTQAQAQTEAPNGATAWVQIESQPSLTRVQTAIRRYADGLQDVNGFTSVNGWYAIALGPYTPDEAAQVLRVYKSEGIIPQDSFIARSPEYKQQFWPVGANLLTATTPAQSDPDTTQTAEVQAEIQASEPDDETPRQARASEARLTRDERAELQTALKWAGFYGGQIDAAFGRGTRGSMARWQEANVFDPTGVLTSRQRTILLGQYNAVLKGMDLRQVQDEKAGIDVKLPLGVVAFDRYEAPFAHYTASGDVDARVLLISQKGDRNTLGGLYDVMQTLAIVPETGPRALEKNAFSLIGEGALFISHTQAWLKDGEIKGFTLIWPAGDEERRTRILGEIQKSFARTDGVLDAAAGAASYQNINLISGLEIRKPKLSRSGFFVDKDGAVVTTGDIVQGCTKITIDQEFHAQIAAQDEALGIVILRPDEALAPRQFARFQQDTPNLQSDIAVSGYSYSGLLNAPTLTFGHLAELSGLNGEPALKRLALNALDGDAGGPVVDAGGAVLGMLLPEAAEGGRQLPEGVSFAAKGARVQSLLREAGIAPSATSGIDQIPAETLTRLAADMTALVSCWGE